MNKTTLWRAGALALLLALLISGAVFAEGETTPEVPVENSEAPPAYEVPETG